MTMGEAPRDCSRGKDNYLLYFCLIQSYAITNQYNQSQKRYTKDPRLTTKEVFHHRKLLTERDQFTARQV